jgi:flagellar motor switch protein FliN/FliY
MVNQGNHQAARAFAGVFAESFAEALTRAAGSPWEIKILNAADLSAQQGEPVHFRLNVDGALNGSLFVELYDLQARTLAAKIVGARVPAFVNEHSEALERVLSAAMDRVAASLEAEYGPFTCRIERASGLAFGGMLHIPLAAHEAEQPGLSMALYFDGQLLSALAIPPPAQDADPQPAPAIDPLNLGLVMDVELNVSLRFGQRQLPLREVLELASGSVIELDRQVDDPVELLLDGKVIARGEAVIVDGNYGLRVTEIPQPMASHFTR